MHLGITINIIDYFPKDFDFTGYNFIFIYEAKQVDKEISYLKKNNIYHKLFMPSKRDIKYSIRMTRNDSLIGLSEYIIPFSILHKKDTNYEKTCPITMTDSLKKLIFGSSTSSNQIKINIHSSLQYFGNGSLIKEKSLRKNKSNINKEIYDTKILTTGKEKEPKSNRVIFNFKSDLNNNSLSIRKDKNNISNRNILKSHKIYMTNQNSSPFPYTQVVSPKKYLLYNIPGTDLKKIPKTQNVNTNNEFHKIKNTEEEITENNLNDEDPNDRSRIDRDLENEEKYGDKKLYEFINNLMKENPLEELDNKKDIGEMIMYTKDIISQLLEYQIKFYEVLKKSSDLNHKFNELLLKYNEKYRLTIKKMNKLNEEMNMHDMKCDIILNKNNQERNDINEMITLKNKELDIFKDIYKIQDDEENFNTTSSDTNNNIKLKILLNFIQKITSKYGPLHNLITQKNSSDKEIKNLNYILNKYKEELSLNKKKEKSNNIRNKEEIIININDDEVFKNETDGLEYVLSDNPDELDKILNKNLKNIYNNKKVSKIIFKRIGKNSYEYGSRKVLIKRDDENVKVRLGGLFTSLDKFIESNSSIEHIKQNLSQKKLSNNVTNKIK